MGDTRRIPVVTDADWDYADAFEVVISVEDQRTAEQWARAALDVGLARIRPLVLLIHRRVLRFRLGPTDSATHILGWKLEESEQDLIRLTADGPLMHGVLLGRRTAPDRTELRTFLSYKKPRAAIVWRVIGPIHRLVARYLLRQTARS